MLIRSSLRQARRAPVRMTACFVLMALVCAFLTIGLNLKKAADENLETVLNNFNVVAAPDFQGYIDKQGHLTASLRDSIGYLPCRAENYDLEQLSELPGVLRIDARNQFGACVKVPDGALYQLRGTRSSSLRYAYGADVVIFQLSMDKPITIEGWKEQKIAGNIRLYAEQFDIPIRLIWAATGRTELTRLTVMNPSDRVYTLEPGKTYIINMGESGDLTRDIYHQAYPVKISENGAYSRRNTYSDGSPVKYPPVTEYYEGFWDTDMGRYYRQSAEACYLNGSSLTAVTTGDLSMIPAWAGASVYLRQGNAFSPEDYQNGNRVCIISQPLLELMDWEIGDTIDLSFYQTSYILHSSVRDQYSTFDPYLYGNENAVAAGTDNTLPMEHIFDENTYAIIGTYDGKVCIREDEEGWQSNAAMHWLTVLLPEKSVQNQPAVALSQYSTTIRVEPLMVQKFLAAAQSSGLMDEQSYGYQLGLTIDDHGLSGMISGLESLQQISQLAVLLASVTAGLSVLVLAILHLLKNRKQIAILRSMGVKRSQTATFILAGILLVSIVGTVVGGCIGGVLSETVTQRIVRSAQEETMDSSFSAVMVSDSSESDFRMSTGADPSLTWLTAGAVFGALLLLSAGLVLWESKKPPLLMLGVKE